MYIRRKVFSVLTNEMGEERLYSVNETVFEGFEYDEVDERIFAEKEEKKGGKGKKIAAGVVGTTAATAAGLYAAKKGHLGAKAGEAVNKVIMKYAKQGGKVYENAVKDATKAQTKKIKKQLMAELSKEFPGSAQANLRKNLTESRIKDALDKYSKDLVSKVSK